MATSPGRGITSPRFGESGPEGSWEDILKSKYSPYKERYAANTPEQRAQVEQGFGTRVGRAPSSSSRTREPRFPKGRVSRGDPKRSNLAKLNFGTWEDWNGLKGQYAGMSREEADRTRSQLVRAFVAEARQVDAAIANRTFVPPKEPGVFSRLGSSLKRRIARALKRGIARALTREEPPEEGWTKL